MNAKISFFSMLFSLLFVLGACEDYEVKVAPAPDGEVNMTLSPDETLIFNASQGESEITILSNMPASTMSIAVKDTTWCKADLVGNTVKIRVSENLKYVARSTSIAIKVFSKMRTIDIQQEAKEFNTEPAYPIEKVYRIGIPSPASFTDSKIYKVMDGEQKIAEICLEYLNNAAISSRAVVIYVGKGSAASYNDGFVAYFVDESGNVTPGDNNGGKVIFDADANTMEYFAGNSEPVYSVYLSAYGITKEEQDDAVDIACTPYRVSDISGNSYPVVKIGNEVWLGSNLRTTQFGDGTAIDVITSDKFADYKNNVPFATYPMANTSIDLVTYGYLYNAITVTADNEVLLGESIVDGSWRVATGGGSSAAGVMGSGTDWQRLFKYVGENQLGALLAKGYSWNNGGNGEFDIATVSDITGLSIVPAGEMYNITGSSFAIGANTQAFFFYGDSGGRGYNLAERDGRVVDQAGVREWNHISDACSIRLVRIDR